MKETSSKHYAWLKSIRIMTRNGYMCDDDCERIQKYFLKEIQRTVQQLFVSEQDTNKAVQQ